MSEFNKKHQVHELNSRIRRMLQPSAVVFVGGSNLVAAIENTQKKGFAGRVYVVNPKHATICGIPCHPRVADLPEVPDLAFVAVPKEAVVETVASLAEFGVGGSICNSAGFSELRGEGEARQAALVAAAGEMPLLGPNCPGLANFLDSAVFTQDHFGDHEGVTEGVAVISNGGAYLSDLGCARRSLPVSHLVGVGNQAMLTIADILDVILDDERVRAVNLYIESLRDVPALSRAALKAARKGVPVVVVKGGRTQAGDRAAQSHTASLAGDSVIATALFERLGFIEARTPIEAIETLKMLVLTRRAGGRKLALATSSGSYAVLGSDAAESAGLALPPLSDEAVAAVQQRLPAYVLANNPLDISDGQFAPEEEVQRTFDLYLRDSGYDLAVLVMSFPPPGGWIPDSWHTAARAFGKAASELGLPAAFINTVPEDLPEDARRMMVEHGVAPLMGLEHGMGALASAARYSEILARLSATDDQHIELPELDATSSLAAPGFDELEAKALLGRYGVSTPRGHAVSLTEQFPGTEIRFPVALKALSADLLHKTEVGAVALGIDSVEALNEAIAAMADRVQTARPDLQLNRYLIEEMVTDGVGEIMVGIRHAPGYGLALTVAIGGVAVELLRDAATLLLPASRDSIERALGSLQLFPLLTGWRGRVKADIDAAVDAIEAMARFAMEHRDRLDTLEVNPLILRPEGKGAVAVDAVLKLWQSQ